MATGQSESDDSSTELYTTGTLPFAGLTRFNTDVEIPDVWGHGSSMRWWTADYYEKGDEVEVEDLPDSGLNTRIAQLPTASDTQATWEHPLTGDPIPTSKHNAVFNPDVLEQVTTYTDRRGEQHYIGTEQEARELVSAWLADDGSVGGGELAVLIDEVMDEAQGDHTDSELVDAVVDRVVVGDDALYQIPTSSHTIWNPAEFLDPLAEVIQDEGLDDAVFGEFRVSETGGSVTADVFFDGKHVQAPNLDETRKPIVTGFQLGWDFLGNNALTAQGMALDTDCMNAMRGITDKVKIKYAGSKNRLFEVGDQEAGSFREVWDILMEEIDLKCDQLSQFIQEASEVTLDFSELPDDFAQDYASVRDALYAYLGYPDYLADRQVNNGHASMGERLRARADDPYEPTFWDIHSAATWGITNFARGDVGKQSVEQMNQTANDLLMNPHGMEERIIQSYEAHLRERDQTTLADVGEAKAEIETAFESVREKKEEFEERREEIMAIAAGNPAEGD